jgi:hypothetical protein
MDTRTTRSTAENPVKSLLYHHERLGALECMGCFEMVEIPIFAVIKQGQPPVRIKGDPLNLLLWRELIEMDHEPCMQFKDDCIARQAREYRSPQYPFVGPVRRATA